MRYVKIEKVLPGMVLGADVNDFAGQICFIKGTVLSQNIINSLRYEGFQGIVIDDTLSESIQLENDFSSYKYAKGANLSSVRDLMRIAVDIVDDVIRKHPTRISIHKIQSYNDYLNYHGINTAIYSTVIGKEVGLDRDGLYLLAKAAILHDIGMTKVSPILRNKKGKLSDSELSEIRNHVGESENILKDYSLSSIIMKAIADHHENENGSGYPRGRSLKEISDFAKIIHVADVFDAMTTKKNYKDAYNPADVLDYFTSGSGILFHAGVVKAALKKIDAYPIGSEIVLSNGKRALVSGRTEENFRPKVLLVESGKEISLDTDNEYKYVAIKGGSLGESATEANSEDSVSSNANRVCKKKSIMVVDDTYIARRTVEEALNKEFSVVTFGNGFDALSYIKDKRNKVSLIIMDIEMPEMDGIKTVTKIRDAGITDVPVMFLTSINNRETVYKCLSAGAVDYILKPAKQIYVYERVKEVLKFDLINV